MRPVVFGPSPLMEAALGVFKGQELGRKRVRDDEDRDDELAKRTRDLAAADRRAEMDALTLAHQTISNDTASDTRRQRQAKQARADAAAAKLRAHPEFNADKRYGDITDPADAEHDYDADYEREAKIRATKRALMNQGMAEDKAEAAARYDVDEEALVNQRTTAKQKQEREAAEIGRVKAQTAADWTRARGGGSGGGGSNPRLDRQINDQEQVVSAAARAVPTKREGLAQVINGQPLDAGAAAAYTADSTGKARTSDTERARLAALKSVRGDQDVMRRGGYAGDEPDADGDEQAMAEELTAVAERAQRILANPRATDAQKATIRDWLSREQSAIVRQYQGESR